MKHPYFSLAIAGLMASTQAIAQDRPNIILFLVDDMGVMDTSVPFLTDAEGQVQTHPLNQWYHTPNMERLANQGIRFSTFYAQSVSSPSRTSIMTGQNAGRHRTTNWINSESNNRTTYGPNDWNWEGITSDTPVYPKLLQEAGYRTIHVGKAHFGCIGSEGEDPRNVGFDVNIGGNSIGQPGSYYGEWGYGFIKGNKSRAVPGLEKYHGSDVFLTDALTLEANAEMEKAVKEGRPFYLNMSHYAVHQPFETDKRYIDRYKGSEKGGQAEAFATLVEGMDKSLGDLMQKLEDMGVAENTLILFLGDNGGDAPLGGPADYGSSAPLRGKKGSEYEGGVRVPFIAAWAKPDAKNKFQGKYPIARNAVQLQQGTVMDLYPTILSIAGVDVPKDYTLDGSDLKKLLQGKKDKNHRDDFLMHFPHGEHRANYFTTYRKGDWKLNYYYNPENPNYPSWKLYNLKEDPFEAFELSAMYPEKVTEMIKQMKERLEKEKALYPVDKDGNVLCNLAVPTFQVHNPISPMGVYIADPTARVWKDGNLYVYGSLDESPSHYCSKNYHVMATSDLKNWTLHPYSFRNDETLYAPDAWYKDGQYYLYYDIPNGNEYVAVSDSPTGPFKNGVQIEGPKQIDPNIFIDDDGQAYYFWGQFSAKGAKMNPDLKTLDWSTYVDGIVTEADHYFHEGSYVIKRGEYYYFIYADISQNKRPTSIGYAMAKSPLGPYEYKGVIVNNAGCDPETWNNHGSIVQFGDQWYVFYHRSTHGSRTMRKACMEPIKFNPDGTIDEVEMTSQGAGGPLDAFQPVYAAQACWMKGNIRIRRMEENHMKEELGAIRHGDIAAWKYLDFGKGAKKMSILVKSAQGGEIIVRADSKDGDILGTFSIPANADWKVYETAIKETSGIHALWMEYKGQDSEENELFRIERFIFDN